MLVEISYSGTARSDALDAAIHRALGSSIGRFGSRITRVEAHVTDENGSKHGARDKRCVLEARPTSMDPIAVTHEGSDLFDTVREAARKLERALSRRFDKADDVTHG